MLSALGLDHEAESVYRAMLARPDLGVAGLAEELGLPVERIRRACDTLARMTLVGHGGGDGSGVHAVSPDVGLTSLLAEREADLAERQRELAVTRASVARLLSDYDRRGPARRRADVRLLDGIDEIRFRIGELARTCEGELMAFADGGPQSAQTMAASRPLDEEQLGRGVRMRTVYLSSIANSPATVEYARWLEELGASVRTASALPMRMTIYDRRTAVVPTDPEDATAGALVLRGSGLVAALCALFEHVWQEAVPLDGDGRARRSGSGLSDQAHAVLGLLAQGHTDDVVARRLGVSVRTARRITAELMERLGARSRFQAGVVAGERGWLQGGDGPAFP
ncbi:LuxR C-terminal-related transcriptional regulator [Streptomyces sp. NPDC059708]|uniref:LuxR C-terminal-related transcriptional regulator n=1 Tax=Streptomyces sp. NPDC059708 TaxID=3346916 RepID=UPI00369002A7